MRTGISITVGFSDRLRLEGVVRDRNAAQKHVWRKPLADVPSERPQFRNTYQWTIWTISGLDAQYQEPLNKFYETVMSRPRL